MQDVRFKYDADLTHFVKFALRGLVQEIDDIQDKILFFVRTTMFPSYVNELYSKNTINMRCAALLEFLVKYKGSITIQQLRDKKDPIIRALYDRIKTHKTIQRDIDTMVKEGVLVVKDDVLMPNVFIMEQFEG